MADSEEMRRFLPSFRPIVLLWVHSLALAAVDCGPASPAWRDEVQSRINALRSQGEACGGSGQSETTASLVWSSTLERMAQEQVAWVAQRGDLDHAGPDGEPLGARARAVGYRFNVVAENLAAGTLSLEDTLVQWRRSDAHCRNLFDAQITEMALACQSGPGGPWWVMALGHRRLK